MRIVAFSGFGGPEVLHVADAAVPRAAAGEVVVRVAAAGVNRADLLQREGRYPPPSGAPDWPGLEVAGTVSEVGVGVDRWAVGDAVCALLPGGGYAELAVARAEHLLPAPAGIPLAEGAALVEAACTVWSNLREAGAEPGETLLVHGGSGGIGTVAIQVGRALGMRVVATARGPERAARCAALGADVAIDYVADDFVEILSDRGGADVILDVLGGVYLDRNLNALAVGGRLVVIGLQGGAHGDLDLGLLLRKRGRVIGTTLRARTDGEKAAIIADVAREVWPWVPDRLAPIVHAELPFERAADAHRLLDSGEVFGKLLLIPSAA